MGIEIVNNNASNSNASNDQLLNQIEYDMGEMLLPLFEEALAYGVNLASSIIMIPMMHWIVEVVNDLEALKTGTAKDLEAYNSPTCQSLLGFLTTPQPDNTESLYTAASESDNNETANIIYCMEYLNLFNSKSGLIGQVRLFLALYCPTNNS